MRGDLNGRDVPSLSSEDLYKQGNLDELVARRSQAEEKAAEAKRVCESTPIGKRFLAWCGRYDESSPEYVWIVTRFVFADQVSRDKVWDYQCWELPEALEPYKAREVTDYAVSVDDVIWYNVTISELRAKKKMARMNKDEILRVLMTTVDYAEAAYGLERLKGMKAPLANEVLFRLWKDCPGFVLGPGGFCRYRLHLRYPVGEILVGDIDQEIVRLSDDDREGLEFLLRELDRLWDENGLTDAENKQAYYFIEYMSCAAATAPVDYTFGGLKWGYIYNIIWLLEARYVMALAPVMSDQSVKKLLGDGYYEYKAKRGDAYDARLKSAEDFIGLLTTAAKSGSKVAAFVLEVEAKEEAESTSRREELDKGHSPTITYTHPPSSWVVPK